MNGDCDLLTLLLQPPSRRSLRQLSTLCSSVSQTSRLHQIRKGSLIQVNTSNLLLYPQSSLHVWSKLTPKTIMFSAITSSFGAFVVLTIAIGCIAILFTTKLSDHVVPTTIFDTRRWALCVTSNAAIVVTWTMSLAVIAVEVNSQTLLRTLRGFYALEQVIAIADIIKIRACL